jgi:hypothetical protein
MESSAFIKRNFLNQTGDFDFTWNFYVDNATGSVEFGVSGQNGKYSYFLISGELYDPYENLLGSYLPNESISLRNLVVGGKDTLYLQNEIEFYFKDNNFFTNHNYNYFYVDPKNCVLNFDFYLNGEVTDLTIEAKNKRFKNENTNERVDYITGTIYNAKPNLQVKIFDMQVLGNKMYYLTGNNLPLVFNNETDIYFAVNTGDPDYGNKSVILSLDTNFGTIEKSIYITGEYIPLVIDEFTISPSGESFFNNNNFQDFNINHGKNDGSSLSFEINYLDGVTGDITGYISGTGYFESKITGYVSGSGYVSKILQDKIIVSGYNDFNKRLEFDVFPENQIEIEKFVYATGFVEYDFSLQGRGLGTGYIYQDIKTTGLVEKQISGIVSYLNGGIVSITEDNFIATGYDVDAYGNRLQITGYAKSGQAIKKIYYNGEITGIEIPADYLVLKSFTGNIGDRSNAEIISDPYIQTGIGYYTGVIKAGIVNTGFFLNFHPGYYTFRKISNGISGEGFFADSTELILTGFESLLTNNANTGNVQYKLSGIIDNSDNLITVFLDYCSSGSNLVKYTILNTGANLTGYIVKGGSIDNVANKPNFIYIRPTGKVELENVFLENLDYLTGNEFGDRIRTRISHPGPTNSGTGYFSGLFFNNKQNIESGIWEHRYHNVSVETDEYLSQNFNNRISFNLNVLEDNFIDNPNNVLFRFTGV